jgi:hypothetical protein
MTAIRTKKPKLALVAEMAKPPICPCELMPRGEAGVVRIGSGHYALEYNAELPQNGQPVVYGYRVVKPDGTAYDLPHDLSSCDCLGGLHHGRCKHQAALRQLRAEGAI